MTILLALATILFVLWQFGLKRTVLAVLTLVLILLLWAFFFGAGLLFSMLFENAEVLRTWVPPSEWTQQYKWSMTSLGQALAIPFIGIAELLYWSAHITVTVKLFGPKLAFFAMVTFIGVCLQFAAAMLERRQLKST